MHNPRDEPSRSGMVAKPTQIGSLILEAWIQGYLLLALIIMACITLANMRRRVLLHKLILIEVHRSTTAFPPTSTNQRPISCCSAYCLEPPSLPTTLPGAGTSQLLGYSCIYHTRSTTSSPGSRASHSSAQSQANSTSSPSSSSSPSGSSMHMRTLPTTTTSTRFSYGPGPSRPSSGTSPFLSSTTPS